ncbi:hypothetical protein [Solicola sp. PLA-1-18]|uniref:hypothetical protein n=1 Tax=Solicola sp. PLA-1-18 TaxID=3380532 RepID=UPI003B75DD0D
MTVDVLLSQVLHVEDGAILNLTKDMDAETAKLTLRLDHAVRLRNPGLHYVSRSKFVGYRREGSSLTTAGERSQIFLSVVRNKSRLEVFLPVDPDDFTNLPNAADLRGRGHHGVGDLRVSLATGTAVDQFVAHMGEWLKPEIRNQKRPTGTT